MPRTPCLARLATHTRVTKTFGLLQGSCTEISNLQIYCCHKMVLSSSETLGMHDQTAGVTDPSIVML